MAGASFPAYRKWGLAKTFGIFESVGMNARPEHFAVAAKLRSIGISRGHASEIARGRAPSDPMALRIWRETGLKFGRVASLTDDEIKIFAKAVEAA